MLYKESNRPGQFDPGGQKVRSKWEENMRVFKIIIKINKSAVFNINE